MDANLKRDGQWKLDQHYRPCQRHSVAMAQPTKLMCILNTYPQACMVYAVLSSRPFLAQGGALRACSKTWRVGPRLSLSKVSGF